MSNANSVQEAPFTRDRISQFLGKSLLEKETKNFALKILRLQIILGLLVIFIYVFLGKFNSNVGIGNILTSALVIAGAALIIGAFIGFLFGIPRTLQTDIAAKDENGNSITTYNSNTNLEQISDWLTKTIVGIGLTQLYNVPTAIESFGEKIGPSLGGDDTAQIVGIALSLFFAITGFLYSYLWTRVYLKNILTRSDDSVPTNVFKKSLQQRDEYTKENVPSKEEFAQYKLINKSTDTGDPEKGKWGGLSINNNRKISASVVSVSFDKNLYNIILDVQSTDTINYPLTGQVQFHLHPTFKNAAPKVDVINGVAKLNLLSWGAFTVGAETDNGNTKLELDLALIPNAPQTFKEQ